jgi:high-affinity iron transporter
LVPSLLIMVREGFEAALVVALVFAYLRKIGRLDMAKATWAGVAAAAGVSVALAIGLHVTVGGLVGVARLRSFATISLLAAGVLTWMVFWMRRQARAIKGQLEHKVDDALGQSGAALALAMVAFLAVLREGTEAALFLVAAATDSDGADVVVGAVVGLAVAVVLGAVVYAGGRRLPMRAFFQVTGIVVIVFAAGLLARTVLFLQSAGDVGSLNSAVYDLTSHQWLTQGSQSGKFLGAMLGWDPRPSIEQVVIWALYLAPVTLAFLRGSVRATATNVASKRDAASIAPASPLKCPDEPSLSAPTTTAHISAHRDEG